MAGRRERGPQRGGASPTDGSPAEAPWTGTGGAELEELHVAAAVSRGSTRISAGTGIAGVALVGLLAVGFGAFGGRPQASSSPTSGAVALASEAPQRTTSPTATPVPVVTPFDPCAVERDIVPRVFLVVDGVEHSGDLELLSVTLGQLNPDLPPEVGRTGEPVEIPFGAGTSIRIDGARCAVGWVIDYDGTTTVEVRSNGTLDPARAAQNRFALTLGKNPGRESLLRAQLLFPGFSSRASWVVHVARTEHPKAELQWLNGIASTPVVGCYVAVGYGTGWREPPDGCESHGPPVDVASVDRGAAFLFVLPDWTVAFGGVTCGHGIDESFVYEEAGCGYAIDERGAVSVDFPPSFANGPGTLSIDACGVDGPIPDAQICGTWYASVRLR